MTHWHKKYPEAIKLYGEDNVNQALIMTERMKDSKGYMIVLETSDKQMLALLDAAFNGMTPGRSWTYADRAVAEGIKMTVAEDRDDLKESEPLGVEISEPDKKADDLDDLNREPWSEKLEQAASTVLYTLKREITLYPNGDWQIRGYPRTTEFAFVRFVRDLEHEHWVDIGERHTKALVASVGESIRAYFKAHPKLDRQSTDVELKVWGKS